MMIILFRYKLVFVCFLLCLGRTPANFYNCCDLCQNDSTRIDYAQNMLELINSTRMIYAKIDLCDFCNLNETSCDTFT